MSADSQAKRQLIKMNLCGVEGCCNLAALKPVRSTIADPYWLLCAKCYNKMEPKVKSDYTVRFHTGDPLDSGPWKLSEAVELLGAWLEPTNDKRVRHVKILQFDGEVELVVTGTARELWAYIHKLRVVK